MAAAEILALVRAGVRRFILNEASFGEFQATLQDVAENGKPYTHQLTQQVFSNIVREEMRNRKLRRLK